MRLSHKITAALITIVISASVNAFGQAKKYNYANIPDELVAYDKYQKAYKYHFLKPLEFYGAGREKPEPKGVSEVRIGFLGPLEGAVLIDMGKQMLNGSTLAIEEANKKGGYKGIPFKLMVHNDVGLWGAGANEIVKMDDEHVWAWLGTIDDVVSHVAIRATLKLEIPCINSGNPDPTFSETNIPWAIRVIPDDRQSSYVLVNQIFKTDGHKRVAVIRVNNRYGRVGTLHFNRSATRMGFPIVIEERFSDGESVFKSQIERVKNAKPDAIAIWGNAHESALILNQLRDAGLNQPVYASDRVVNEQFLKIAGKNAEGLKTTCQYNPESNSPYLKAFQAAYQKRFNMKPDVIAAHAYDGMNILIESIRKAGMNRALIRDLLTDMKTFNGYEGVTGKIIFDDTWNNIRPISLAQVRNGKFEFKPSPPLTKDENIYKKVDDRY